MHDFSFTKQCTFTSSLKQDHIYYICDGVVKNVPNYDIVYDVLVVTSVSECAIIGHSVLKDRHYDMNPNVISDIGADCFDFDCVKKYAFYELGSLKNYPEYDF